MFAATPPATTPATRGNRMRLLQAAVPTALAQGRLEEAQALADEMVQLARARARNPSASADVGEAYLSRALVLAARGRSTEAHTAAREAQQVLATALGDTHPLTRGAALVARGEAAGVSILRPHACAGG
jgi:hypothetical protein